MAKPNLNALGGGFAALEQTLAKKPQVKNPAGLAIGRKKLGAAKFALPKG